MRADVFLRPDALTARFGEDRRDARLRGGRVCPARRFAADEDRDPERLRHFERHVAHPRIGPFVEDGERHQRFDQVAAVQVDEVVGRFDDMGEDPRGNLLGRCALRVAGKHAQLARVDRELAARNFVGVGIGHASAVALEVAVEELEDGPADVRAVAVPADTDHRRGPVAGAEQRVQTLEAVGDPLGAIHREVDVVVGIDEETAVGLEHGTETKGEVPVRRFDGESVRAGRRF